MAGITIRPSTPTFAAATAVSHAPAVVYSAIPLSRGTEPLLTSSVALST